MQTGSPSHNRKGKRGTTIIDGKKGPKDANEIPKLQSHIMCHGKNSDPFQSKQASNEASRRCRVSCHCT